MAILPEELNVKEIEKWLKANNVWYQKNFGNQFTRSGVPDLIVALRGRFIGLEVKKHKGGKASPLQIYNRDWLEQTGNICLIVNDYEETIIVLEKYLREV